MQPYDSVRVKLSFNGKPPVAFLRSAIFLENQRSAPACWGDPGTAGNTLLRDILQSQPADLETMRGVVTLTTGELDKAGCRLLLGLVGVWTDERESVGLILRNAAMVFEVGKNDKAKNLIRMEVTKLRLGLKKHAIVSTETLESRMYAMNCNGICFVVEPEICLDAEKLPGAKFFNSEDEMDAAGVSRWGENGSQHWRCMVSVLNGSSVILNEMGQLYALGDEPEIQLNSFGG
ncbi:hypothetical protein H9T43_002398 [Salmonella enterica]|nr:hypothetical protein [Salmonella enterica]